MSKHNYADLDKRYPQTPPELVGVWPIGGGGIVEAPYRHYFELKAFLKSADIERRMNFLELGSGNGRWALSLAPKVASYIGVDITPAAIELARQRVAEHGIRNTEFVCQSITEFQCDRTIDVVYFSGVSQYLDENDLRRVVERLSPSLSPDTWLVDRSTISVGELAIRDIREEYSSTLRTVPELKSIYGSMGFELVHQTPSYRPLRGGRLLSRKPWDQWLASAVSAASPISLNLMLSWSWLADIVLPIDIAKRGWSHDFLFFRRNKRA